MHIFSIILICWLALPAAAIVRRHDVSDERYRELFTEHAVLGRSVVRIGRAHGTLISPRWVLSAAHCIDGVSPNAGTVEIDGRRVAVRRVILHPSWLGDLDPGYAEASWIDLGLLELAEPVDDVPSIALWESGQEAGDALLLGSGLSGDGVQGPLADSGAWRAAWNRVEYRDDVWITFRFDRDGLPLEGISGPGDSGGPALLRDAMGTWRLAGVSSRNEGGPECSYGTTEYYTRVQRFLPWIRETMAAPHEIEGDPACDAVVDAFFASYRSGALADFAEQHVLDSPRHTPAQFAELWQRQRARQGEVRPVYTTRVAPHKIFVLAAGKEHWREYHFELEAQEPHRIRSLDVQRVRTRHGSALPDPSTLHEP